MLQDQNQLAIKQIVAEAPILKHKELLAFYGLRLTTLLLVLDHPSLVVTMVALQHTVVAPLTLHVSGVVAPTTKLMHDMPQTKRLIDINPFLLSKLVTRTLAPRHKCKSSHGSNNQ